MAAVTSFPIALADNRLQFGALQLPLSQATSFWVANKGTYEVVICSQSGDYQTNFHLHLENAGNMHHLIKHLLTETALKPSIFSVRKIHLFLRDDDQKGDDAVSPVTIEFKFTNAEERRYFVTYAMPLLPGFELTEEVINGFHVARLTFNQPEDLHGQIQRIQHVFNRIRDTLGASTLKGALLELEDHRFPEEPYAPGSILDPDWSQDHTRSYDVTSETMQERLQLAADVSLAHNLDHAELEAWLADPAAQAGKQKAKIIHHLGELILSALKEDPIDNEKLTHLMKKALSFPEFDLASVMQRVSA